MATPPDGATPPSGRMVAATVAAVLVLAYLVRYAILPLAFAAALAYVLQPAVSRLRRSGLPHAAAVLLPYGTAVAILVGAGWLAAGSLSDCIAAVGDAPALLGRLIVRLIGPEIHVFGQTITAEAAGRQVVESVAAWASQPVALVTTSSILVAAPAGAALTLVALFYFLYSGQRLAAGVLWLAPPRYREHLQGLARRVHPMLRHYVRGLVLVVLYTTAAAWLVLGLVFRLPFAPILSLVVGALEPIPVIGPAIAMVLIGGSALINGDGGWALSGSVAFAIILRLSIDLVVGPLVLGQAVDLHPLAVLFAFLVGASLFGILGVLLAVPVAATIKIVLGVWYDEEPSRAGPP